MARYFNPNLQESLSRLKGAYKNNNEFYKIIKEMYDFQYAGGCGGEGCDASGHIEHIRYYRKKFGFQDMPFHETSCICGQTIVENCYIQCPEGLVIVGNECINRFIEYDEKGRRVCEICGDRHRNNRDNLCNSCRETWLCKKCKVKKRDPKFEHCYPCFVEKRSKLSEDWFCSCGKKKGKKSYFKCFTCSQNLNRI